MAYLIVVGGMPNGRIFPTVFARERLHNRQVSPFARRDRARPWVTVDGLGLSMLPPPSWPLNNKVCIRWDRICG